MLSVIKSIQPQDQIEAMLAAQMAAVHVATMTFARRLAHVEDIRQQDSLLLAGILVGSPTLSLQRFVHGVVLQEKMIAHPLVSASGPARVGIDPTRLLDHEQRIPKTPFDFCS